MLRLLTNRIGFVMRPLVWIDDYSNDPANMSIPAEHYEIAASTRLLNGVSVEVTRDGLFTFDFSDATTGHAVEIQPPGVKGRHSDEWTHERLLVMNGLLACLHSAMQQGTPIFNGSVPLIEKVAVRPNDLIEYWVHRSVVRDTYMHDEGTILYMQGRNDESIRARYAKDDRAERRSFVAPTHVEQAAVILDKILANPNPRALDYVDMILRACEAAESLDYSVALNLNWVVIETLLLRMLRKLQADGPAWAHLQKNNVTHLRNGKAEKFMTPKHVKYLESDPYVKATHVAEALQRRTF